MSDLRVLARMPGTAIKFNGTRLTPALIRRKYPPVWSPSGVLDGDSVRQQK